MIPYFCQAILNYGFLVEGFRVGVLIGFFIIIGFNVSIKCIQLSHKISKLLLFPKNFLRFHQLHKRNYLLVRLVGDSAIVNGSIGWFMCGLIWEAVGVIVVLRMYQTISIYIYVTFIICIIFTPLVHQFELPQGALVHTESLSALHHWNSELRHVSNQNRKYLSKRLKSLQPITFYSGLFQYKFFSFVPSLKTTYYKLMIDAVFTAILSIPC
jgi:hypothetical protein